MQDKARATQQAFKVDTALLFHLSAARKLGSEPRLKGKGQTHPELEAIRVRWLTEPMLCKLSAGRGGYALWHRYDIRTH